MLAPLSLSLFYRRFEALLGQEQEGEDEGNPRACLESHRHHLTVELEKYFEDLATPGRGGGAQLDGMG